MTVLATIAPPRTLAHVLRELTEAVDDLTEAESSVQHALAIEDACAVDEFSDRATEADQRIDALREEFSTRFQEATGLTWKQIETAISEAVL